MIVLADECVSALVVRRLRAAGLDVSFVLEDHASLEDGGVLDLAVRLGAGLLTTDRDFGTLLFAEGRPAPRFVVYYRLDEAEPDAAATRLVGALSGGPDALDDHFTTVTAVRIRSRALR